MAKLTAYELERQANIERNRKMLESMGLDNLQNMLPTRVATTKPSAALKRAPTEGKTKKRKAENIENDADAAEGEVDEGLKKTARVEGDDGSIRRSARVAGKKIDYKAEQDRSVHTYRASTRKNGGQTSSEPRSVSKRIHDPKKYGHIPGIEVGTWWETREDCSIDSIHAPWVSGISAGNKGAFSVALSGGYEDDVDLGYGFTYTGSGGRDLKGTAKNPKNLRTAPQSSDQTFENNFNKSLKRSAETKNPIRVIRGYKLRSQYAPSEGYRYDGLYTIEKAWQEKGLNPKGYLVCKFAFKRLSGQPPLPTKGACANPGDRNSGSASESGSEGTKVADDDDTSQDSIHKAKDEAVEDDVVQAELAEQDAKGKFDGLD